MSTPHLSTRFELWARAAGLNLDKYEDSPLFYADAVVQRAWQEFVLREAVPGLAAAGEKMRWQPLHLAPARLLVILGPEDERVGYVEPPSVRGSYEAYDLKHVNVTSAVAGETFKGTPSAKQMWRPL